MRLDYIFISGYRSFINQGFDLSNEFIIDFNLEHKTIKIKSNPLYIENFFGDNISSYTGIIGENGSGKSTFLNYIKEMLAMPKSNQSQCNCLLIFYKKNNNEFIIVNNLPEISNIEVTLEPLNSKYQIKSLASLIPPNESAANFNTRYTVLESIDELKKLGIVYVSTLFEPERIERDYGPQRPPQLYNLSTNYLYGARRFHEIEGEYLTSESLNILNFIVNAKNSIPEFTLPEHTSIFINYMKISDFFGSSKNIANTINRPQRRNNRNITDNNNTIARLTKLEQDIYDQNRKRSLIKFWLTIHFLTEIYDHIRNEKLNDFLGKLDTTNADALWQSLSSILQKPENYLEPIYDSNERPFLWSSYFVNYDKYIESILSFVADEASNAADNNEIIIPLTFENFTPLRNLLELREVVALSYPYITNFKWGATSSGESAMITVFSRLFAVSQKALHDSNNDLDKIWFLLDECDNSFHPQWEKQFNNLLIRFINNYFTNIECQVLFTTHSPFSISDLPKKNLVFLTKDAKGIQVQNSLNEHKQTFAANINILMTDSFFINDGLIGNFANSKINAVIDQLLEDSLENIIANSGYIERLINIIGEPVVKNKLLAILERRIKANLLQIKLDIDSLKSQK